MKNFQWFWLSWLFPFQYFDSLLVVRNWIWNLFHVLGMERMVHCQFFRYCIFSLFVTNLILNLTAKFILVNVFTATSGKVNREWILDFFQWIFQQANIHAWTFLHFTLSLQFMCDFISSAVQCDVASFLFISYSRTPITVYPMCCCCREVLGLRLWQRLSCLDVWTCGQYCQVIR